MLHQVRYVGNQQTPGLKTADTRAPEPIRMSATKTSISQSKYKLKYTNQIQNCEVSPLFGTRAGILYYYCNKWLPAALGWKHALCAPVQCHNFQLVCCFREFGSIDCIIARCCQVAASACYPVCFSFGY